MAGINCFDNARFNYWGYERPKKLVLGRVKIFPWLLFPANTIDDFNNDYLKGKQVISSNEGEIENAQPTSFRLLFLNIIKILNGRLI